MFCAMSLQVWDCRFVYDMLCFSKCVLVRVFIYILNCLWVWDHMHKTTQLRGSGYYAGCVCLFVGVYVLV